MKLLSQENIHEGRKLCCQQTHLCAETAPSVFSATGLILGGVELDSRRNIDLNPRVTNFRALLTKLAYNIIIELAMFLS